MLDLQLLVNDMSDFLLNWKMVFEYFKTKFSVFLCYSLWNSYKDLIFDLHY